MPESKNRFGIQKLEEVNFMFLHPTGKIPRIVDVVACGPTIKTYLNMRMKYDPVAPKPDEVWSLNKALRTIRADVGFVLDDLVGEYRISPRYGQDLDELDIPIITSTVDNDVRALYPNLTGRDKLFEYPINEVLDNIGLRTMRARKTNRGAINGQVSVTPEEVKEAGEITGYYLHNSIPMILGYAIMLGVERVQLFGADYTFPGMEAREDDRANTEYFVGLLRGFGIELWTTSDTTLLNQRLQPKIYGYGARPPVRRTPDEADLQAESMRLWPSDIR